MHIIFTPLPPFLFFIVSQGNMAAVHGRTRAHSRFLFVPLPRSLARPPVRPPWRWCAMLAGGKVEVSECSRLPAEAPTGCCWSRGGGGSAMCYSVHGCGPWTVLYGACGVRLSPPHTPHPRRRRSASHRPPRAARV